MLLELPYHRCMLVSSWGGGACDGATEVALQLCGGRIKPFSSPLAASNSGVKFRGAPKPACLGMGLFGDGKVNLAIFEASSFSEISFLLAGAIEGPHGAGQRLGRATAATAALGGGAGADALTAVKPLRCPTASSPEPTEPEGPDPPEPEGRAAMTYAHAGTTATER